MNYFTNLKLSMIQMGAGPSLFGLVSCTFFCIGDIHRRWNWKGCWRLLCLAFTITVMVSLLGRSGDVEMNPGPQSEHGARTCAIVVQWCMSQLYCNHFE